MQVRALVGRARAASARVCSLLPSGHRLSLTPSPSLLSRRYSITIEAALRQLAFDGMMGCLRRFELYAEQVQAACAAVEERDAAKQAAEAAAAAAAKARA